MPLYGIWQLFLSLQTSMFGLSLGVLATANTAGARVPISDTAAAGACTAFATLLSSDTLFGATNSNRSNHSAALSTGLKQLASGKVCLRCANIEESIFNFQ